MLPKWPLPPKFNNMDASKNSEFALMQGAGKILVPANLKVTLL